MTRKIFVKLFLKNPQPRNFKEKNFFEKGTTSKIYEKYSYKNLRLRKKIFLRNSQFQKSMKNIHEKNVRLRKLLKKNLKKSTIPKIYKKIFKAKIHYSKIFIKNLRLRKSLKKKILKNLQFRKWMKN